MTRLKIIAIVFLPTMLIAAGLLMLYLPRQLKSQMDATVSGLQNQVIAYSNLLSLRTDAVAATAKSFSSLLSEESKNIPAFIRGVMEEETNISTVMVCYTPEFLDSFLNGEHSDYDMEGIFGEELSSQRFGFFAPSYSRDEVTGYIFYTDNSAKSYHTRRFFLAPRLARKGCWVDPYVDPQTGDTRTVYGVPFYHKSELVGVVVCFVSMSSLVNPEVSSAFSDIFNRGRLSVLGRIGSLLYHSVEGVWPKYNLYASADELGRRDLYPEIDKFYHELAGAVKLPYLGTDEKLRKRNEYTWYIFSYPQNSTEWTVLAAFEESYLHGEIMKGIWHQIGLIFLALVVICSMVSFLMIRANDPIVAMTQVAETLSTGVTDVKVPVCYAYRTGSVGRLVRTYNDMIETLNTRATEKVEAAKRAQNLADELRMAHELQQTFLPNERCRFFPEKGYALIGDLVAAEGVAGDFFDFWQMEDDTLTLIIADVSGKGVAAAMVMVEISTLIRQFSHPGTSPGQVVTAVNSALLKRYKKNMYVSLFFAYYYPKEGRLHYCNAGLNPPFHCKEDGSVAVFQYADNPVVGIDPKMIYSDAEHYLEDNEFLVLYTNGYIEGLKGNGQTAAVNLKSLVTTFSNNPVEVFFNELMLVMVDCQKDAPVDDVTLLVLRRTQDINQSLADRAVFASVYGNEAEVVNTILAEMKRRNWSDRDMFAVEMGLAEGIHNAIEHGNKEDVTKNAQVGYCISDSMVSLAIRDEGFGFNEEAVPDPRDEDNINEPTGRGLLLIHGFMTHAFFNESGNELFMNKVRTPEDAV